MILTIFMVTTIGCADDPSLPAASTKDSPKATQTSPTTTTEVTADPSTETDTPAPDCSVVEPSLNQIEPGIAAPLDEVIITGSGGYLLCNGGYDESARNFTFYFDDQPIDPISCYVNHCQITVNMPADIEPGQHTFSVEGGSSITIEITDD